MPVEDLVEWIAKREGRELSTKECRYWAEAYDTTRQMQRRQDEEVER